MQTHDKVTNARIEFASICELAKEFVTLDQKTEFHETLVNFVKTSILNCNSVQQACLVFQLSPIFFKNYYKHPKAELFMTKFLIYDLALYLYPSIICQESDLSLILSHITSLYSPIISDTDPNVRKAIGQGLKKVIDNITDLFSRTSKIKNTYSQLAHLVSKYEEQQSVTLASKIYSYLIKTKLELNRYNSKSSSNLQRLECNSHEDYRLDSADYFFAESAVHLKKRSPDPYKFLIKPATDKNNKTKTTRTHLTPNSSNSDNGYSNPSLFQQCSKRAEDCTSNESITNANVDEIRKKGDNQTLNQDFHETSNETMFDVTNFTDFIKSGATEPLTSTTGFPRRDYIASFNCYKDFELLDTNNYGYNKHSSNIAEYVVCYAIFQFCSKCITNQYIHENINTLESVAFIVINCLMSSMCIIINLLGMTILEVLVRTNYSSVREIIINYLQENAAGLNNEILLLLLLSLAPAVAPLRWTIFPPNLNKIYSMYKQFADLPEQNYIKVTANEHLVVDTCDRADDNYLLQNDTTTPWSQQTSKYTYSVCSEYMNVQRVMFLSLLISLYKQVSHKVDQFIEMYVYSNIYTGSLDEKYQFLESCEKLDPHHIANNSVFVKHISALCVISNTELNSKATLLLSKLCSYIIALYTGTSIAADSKLVAASRTHSATKNYKQDNNTTDKTPARQFSKQNDLSTNNTVTDISKSENLPNDSFDLTNVVKSNQEVPSCCSISSRYDETLAVHEKAEECLEPSNAGTDKQKFLINSSQVKNHDNPLSRNDLSPSECLTTSCLDETCHDEESETNLTQNNVNDFSSLLNSICSDSDELSDKQPVLSKEPFNINLGFCEDCFIVLRLILEELSAVYTYQPIELTAQEYYPNKLLAYIWGGRENKDNESYKLFQSLDKGSFTDISQSDTYFTLFDILDENDTLEISDRVLRYLLTNRKLTFEINKLFFTLQHRFPRIVVCSIAHTIAFSKNDSLLKFALSNHNLIALCIGALYSDNLKENVLNKLLSDTLNMSIIDQKDDAFFSRSNITFNSKNNRIISSNQFRHGYVGESKARSLSNSIAVWSMDDIRSRNSKRDSTKLTSMSRSLTMSKFLQVKNNKLSVQKTKFAFSAYERGHLILATLCVNSSNWRIRNELARNLTYFSPMSILAVWPEFINEPVHAVQMTFFRSLRDMHYTLGFKWVWNNVVTPITSTCLSILKLIRKEEKKTLLNCSNDASVASTTSDNFKVDSKQANKVNHAYLIKQDKLLCLTDTFVRNLSIFYMNQLRLCTSQSVISFNSDIKSFPIYSSCQAAVNNLCSYRDMNIDITIDSLSDCLEEFSKICGELERHIVTSEQTPSDKCTSTVNNLMNDVDISGQAFDYSEEQIKAVAEEMYTDLRTDEFFIKDDMMVSNNTHNSIGSFRSTRQYKDRKKPTCSLVHVLISSLRCLRICIPLAPVVTTSQMEVLTYLQFKQIPRLVKLCERILEKASI